MRILLVPVIIVCAAVGTIQIIKTIAHFDNNLNSILSSK